MNARFLRSVEDLDETIKQIRMSIFQLRDVTGESSIRSSVLQVVEEAVPALGFTPRVGFDGPLDTVVQPDLVADVRAVVRGALTITAKYAHASAVDVEITTDVANLAVTVADNGTGVPEGGTELRWNVPAG